MSGERQRNRKDYEESHIKKDKGRKNDSERKKRRIEQSSYWIKKKIIQAKAKPRVRVRKSQQENNGNRKQER